MRRLRTGLRSAGANGGRAGHGRCLVRSTGRCSVVARHPPQEERDAAAMDAAPYPVRLWGRMAEARPHERSRHTPRPPAVALAAGRAPDLRRCRMRERGRGRRGIMDARPYRRPRIGRARGQRRSLRLVAGRIGRTGRIGRPRHVVSAAAVIGAVGRGAELPDLPSSTWSPSWRTTSEPPIIPEGSAARVRALVTVAPRCPSRTFPPNRVRIATPR
jgi:hypothetical protein